MPIVNIQMLEGRSDEIKARIAKEVTESLNRHLGSAPEHIYITFEDVPTTNWAWKGELFSNLKKEKQ